MSFFTQKDFLHFFTQKDFFAFLYSKGLIVFLHSKGLLQTLNLPQRLDLSNYKFMIDLVCVLGTLCDEYDGLTSFKQFVKYKYEYKNFCK
jgi:hypothetical protein